jgi:hypothetical protein
LVTPEGSGRWPAVLVRLVKLGDLSGTRGGVVWLILAFFYSFIKRPLNWASCRLDLLQVMFENARRGAEYIDGNGAGGIRVRNLVYTILTAQRLRARDLVAADAVSWLWEQYVPLGRSVHEAAVVERLREAGTRSEGHMDTPQLGRGCFLGRDLIAVVIDI